MSGVYALHNWVGIGFVKVLEWKQFEGLGVNLVDENWRKKSLFLGAIAPTIAAVFSRASTLFPAQKCNLVCCGWKQMTQKNTWEKWQEGLLGQAEELSCEERRKINKHSLWRRRLLLLLLLVALLCWHWWPMSSLEGPIMRSYAWSVKRNKNSWVILPLPSFELMKAPSLFSWFTALLLSDISCENCSSVALESLTQTGLVEFFLSWGECTFDAGLHSSPSPPPFAVMPVANAFQLWFPLIIISFYGMEFTTLWLQYQNCDFLFLQPHGHWWISLLVSHLCYQYILKP